MLLRSHTETAFSINRGALELITATDTGTEVLEAARKTLLSRISLRRARAEQFFSYVHAGAANGFNPYASKGQSILQKASLGSEKFAFENPVISKPQSDNCHDYDDIIESQKWQYTADLTDISGYVVFSILTDYRFVILIHFHERDVLEGGGFVVVALTLEEEIDDSGEAIVTKIPIDPMHVSVEESSSNTTQTKVMKFASKAVSLGVTIWAKSL